MARSLTRLHLQSFLILLLCLIAAGYAGYLAVRDLQRSSDREAATQAVRETASRVNGLIDQQRQALQQIVRQPGVVGALQQGTAAERARQADEIKPLLPGALAVYLLPRDSAGALIPAEALDPADLEYVQRTASAHAPAPEFHALGTPSEHYDLVVPVRDENQKPVGSLLVRFAPAPLRAVLEPSLPPGGYVELQQPVTEESVRTVLTVGEVPENNAATITSALGNTRWTLVYRAAETPPAMLSGNSIYYFAVILFAYTVIAIVFFRLYRQTIQAVRHDIESLIRLFRDLREGSARVDYPMELSEFGAIFEYLRDRGQKLVEEKEKLKGMGLIDHLSQLSNRRHFETRLQELFEASKANGPSSVLIIDMDHFKQVNDRHGHDAGDALIVGFANALRKTVRQTDVLARLGGDEFCIIYAYVPLAKAQVLVERLRAQLPREIPLTKGVIHQLRWTGGLSAMSDKDGKPDDVLWRADQALLQAKEGGRNNTKLCDPVTGLTAKKPIVVG